MTTRLYIAAELASLIAGTRMLLPAGAAGHVARVLRLGPGDELILFDGRGGEHGARIVSIERGRVQVDVTAHSPVERESPLQITLLQGIARGERMDLIIQKSTELGVARILPVFTARTTVKLDEAGGLRKRDHWRAIAASACEQCGRNTLPLIEPPRKLQAALAGVAGTLRLLLDPAGDTTLGRLPLAGAAGIGLLIGPEGGLDAEELAGAARAGFLRCRMGARVLRTETAPLAAIAALQTLAGDLG